MSLLALRPCLGIALREIRLDAQATQKTVAHFAGPTVYDKTVRRWESGESWPTDPGLDVVLNAYAAATGVEPYDIMVRVMAVWAGRLAQARAEGADPHRPTDAHESELEDDELEDDAPGEPDC